MKKKRKQERTSCGHHLSDRWYWDADYTLYTDAQIALFHYISYSSNITENSWPKAVKAQLRSIGLESWFDGVFPLYNSRGTKTTIANKIINMVKEKSKEWKYKANIYVYKPSNSGAQAVIIVDPEDPVPAEQQISVTKIWENWNGTKNGDETYGNRPDKITVKLLYKGSIQKTLELNNGNNWSGTFTGLPGDAKISDYSVEEDTVPGYKTPTITGNGTEKVTITNKLKTKNVKVTKSWVDSDNTYKNRPSSIQVTLYENVGGNKRAVKTQTLNENGSNKWTYTFTNLPTHKNKSEITYTIEETTVPKGYVKSINGNTITNTLEKVNITTTKEWDDNDDKFKNRPSSITVTLYEDGKATTQTKTLNNNNQWKATFTNLPKYKNKKAVTYTVKETVPTGYTSSGDATKDNNYTIKNTQILTDVSVTKIWEDDNNSFGNRPESITVTLYENGTATTQTKTLNRNNRWKATFTNLPKYKNKSEVIYTVRETNVPNGYTCSGDATKDNNYTITNAINPTSVTVTKTWNDDNNKYTNRPDSVEVTLYENGNKTDKKGQLNAGTSWKYTFENIPEYKDGSKINYTVKETVPTGYVASGDATKDNNYTITNTLEKVDISIEKEWKDNNNEYENRPASIDLTLYETRAGVTKEIKTVTLTEKNGWKYTFKNMPKYKNKELVQYTVDEKTIPTGYVKSVDGYKVINTTETVDIPITKVWEDNEDEFKNRPDSITMILREDGKDTDIKKELTAKNGWKETFTGLPKYKKGKLVTYKVREVEPTGYDAHGFGTENNKYTIRNKPQTVSISITKEWEDYDNVFKNRPESIEVVLYENGSETKVKGTLKEANKWQYTFENLPKYKNKKLVKYTVKEIVPVAYDCGGDATEENKYIIKNTLQLTSVKVKKQWDDIDDLDSLRPTTVKITLYETIDGKKTISTDEFGKERIVEIKASEKWEYTFKNLPKYRGRQEITYTVEEQKAHIPTGYTPTVSGDAKKGFTITNKHEPHYDGYIEITGKVWYDGKVGKDSKINGTYGKEDKLLEGIKVTLKDSKGKQFDTTSTAKTDKNGSYTIRVNYDNSNNVYKLYEDVQTVNEKLKESYIEFEYDGIKYTTVKNEKKSSADKSVAVENEERRLEIDKEYSTVEPTTKPESWSVNITANTEKITSYTSKKENRAEIVKYCNGNGTFDHTNHNGAWKPIRDDEKYVTPCIGCKGEGHTRTYEVEVIKYENINLGLFTTEDPDVAIYSDLSKVEVTMNGQKYSYLYNIRSDKLKNAELKVKFQNKDTYTYRRPVNPADIAYVQEEANKDAMSVLVTYEVKVANLSSTVHTTIHKITNSYDSRYELTTPGWTTTDVTGFKQSTNDKDLKISVEPQKESEPIKLTYSVSLEAIRRLLNEEATLNNAVEIHTYSTQYGEKTLYAEQRTGGRTNNPYMGYDRNSHPGNAGIFINAQGRLEAAKLEDDTDIAPSFALCKDAPKTLSGRVWEDSDSNTRDKERLGDGKYNNREKKVKNVKVELYNMNGTRAKLYDRDGNAKNAVVYTNGNGEYSLEGVVTGEYFIKYTYGNATEKVTTIGDTTVNARNYKSTIITDETIRNIFGKNYTQFSKAEKMWHITHGDEYSIAVDNMKDRLDISALTYSTYDVGEDMTAYTKPFETQVEFETTGQSQVRDESGDIGVTKNLNKLNFGIIERPREDLFVEKTITHFKIALENGQVLTEGNPSNPQEKMNYAKAIGFNQKITSGQAARKALEKQLLVEVDSELIQAAQLEVEYAVKVTNNNEIDYDYGVETDYTDIIAETTRNENDKYITKNPKANYYYYGEKTGLNEMKAIIEFVDYLDKDMIYKEDTTKWNLIKASDLQDAGLISLEAETAVNNNPYNVLQSAAGAATTLARGESFGQNMTATKLLANKEDNVYDNNAEIIKIDGKTARTVKLGGVTYKPGNYIPNMNSNIQEQDDDRVKVVITPPTGATNYTISYVITTLIGLVIIAIVVIFVKKKVSKK